MIIRLKVSPPLGYTLDHKVAQVRAILSPCFPGSGAIRDTVNGNGGESAQLFVYVEFFKPARTKFRQTVPQSEPAHHMYRLEREYTTNGANMSVPSVFPILQDGSILYNNRVIGKTTLEEGRTIDATSSGTMNKLTSQPQARSLKVRSCHNATKEKTTTVFKKTFLEPPSGM